MTTRYERLSSRSRRLEVIAAVAAATFTVVMCRLVPGPPAGAAPSTPPAGQVAADARPGGAGAERPAVLPRSSPVHLAIAGTGVDADVVTTRRADGSLPVALPGRPMQLVWDAGGPAPGERGAAVLVGHLDSADGPAAFAGLGGLRAGARVRADRADGRTARFEVYAVERYAAGGVPDAFLLGDTSSGSGPQLRLVARGGTWTDDSGDDSTVVAYARAAPADHSS